MAQYNEGGVRMFRKDDMGAGWREMDMRWYNGRLCKNLSLLLMLHI